MDLKVKCIDPLLARGSLYGGIPPETLSAQKSRTEGLLEGRFEAVFPFAGLVTSVVLRVMTHIDAITKYLRGKEPGVEIGAFKTPLPGIAPIYVDKYAVYAHEECLGDYFGEAHALPFRDNSLAYVATSHVLEHTANPIQALLEWYRVLRPGGIIYLVVPDRRYTWDHARAATPVHHFIEDFTRATTAVDATHIDDFVDNVDWATYSPGTPREKWAEQKAAMKRQYHAAVRAGEEINIHFHTFEPYNLRLLLNTVGEDPRFNVSWDLLEVVERFPDDNPIGLLAVVRVNKGVGDLVARWKDLIAVPKDKRVLRADAVRLRRDR